MIGAGVILVTGLALTGKALLDCRQAAGNLDGQLASAQEKASANEEAATKVTARLQACLDGRRLDEEAQRAASRDYAEELARMAGDIERERAARERAAIQDESCAAWRAAVVCQPLSDRMRDAAARSQGDDLGG